MSFVTQLMTSSVWLTAVFISNQWLTQRVSHLYWAVIELKETEITTNNTIIFTNLSVIASKVNRIVFCGITSFVNNWFVFRCESKTSEEMFKSNSTFDKLLGNLQINKQIYWFWHSIDVQNGPQVWPIWSRTGTPFSPYVIQSDKTTSSQSIVLFSLNYFNWVMIALISEPNMRWTPLRRSCTQRTLMWNSSHFRSVFTIICN